MEPKYYIVGGFVRDWIMGTVPKDRDFVVVGANHDYMIKNGFNLIGVDFPVYLDNKGDEYALARRERSNGSGYVDFTFETNDVTIEEDLFRRDLTINAMAIDVTDTMETNDGVIDPYGGKQDVHNKIFRPVSEHFMEDPVRVLRVARLRARYGKEWGYAPELRAMVSKMAKKGSLSALQPDRVWKEMSRALMEDHPRLFFDTLLELDALHVVFPEIYKLLTALESHRWHPEGNAYEHTMLVLTQAAKQGYDIETRFSCVMHDLGKTLTPFNKLPTHYGHDVNGVKLVQEFCDKYHVPTDFKKYATFATRYHMYMHKLNELNVKTFVSMFDVCRANVDCVKILHEVGVCDERGRLGSEQNEVFHLSYIMEMRDAYSSVKFADVFPNGETNVEKIKNGMYRARIAALKKVEWVS